MLMLLMLMLDAQCLCRRGQRLSARALPGIVLLGHEATTYLIGRCEIFLVYGSMWHGKPVPTYTAPCTAVEPKTNKQRQPGIFFQPGLSHHPLQLSQLLSGPGASVGGDPALRQWRWKTTKWYDAVYVKVEHSV
ncbi:hypothetical protein F4678DRAFT_423284 [Xylaria arbuscula]|nr:hypothetical protein F4678DRAFT_423284 [Xylaria arbuscula]